MNLAVSRSSVAASSYGGKRTVSCPSSLFPGQALRRYGSTAREVTADHRIRHYQEVTVSQPPAGGYPPPEQPPGSYPPPAPAGPPPAQPGYQPPAGGYPPPPTAPGTYPPPPAAPGGYPPPPAAAGGYQPPAGGYPPPPAGPQGYPPQGYPQQPGYPPPPRPAGGFDPSKVSISDWIVLGGGVLYLIFSFLAWQWPIRDTYLYYGVRNGWGSFYIIGTLLILAVVIVRALQMFVPQAGLQRTVKVEWLAYAAAAGAAVVLISVIVILISSGLMYAGAWLGLIAALGVAYGMWLSAQKAGARLPVKLPGPA